MKGEVAYLQGDYLIAKMLPAGTYRLFVLRPGKTATIDGKVMPLNKAPIGTVLTAVCDRDGDAGYRPDDLNPEGQSLGRQSDERHPDSRERRERTVPVPPEMRFDVDGKKLEAMELRQGMNLTATKIVESQRTEVTRTTSSRALGRRSRCLETGHPRLS